MKRLIFACLMTFATALPSFSQEVTNTVLDNGMEVVVIEDHRAPVVVHMVWYKIGGADEPLGKSGIAHFLEHLMFKATDDMESGEFSEVVAENGGSDNAFTSYDATAYFQRVASDRLGLMMSMEAERMTDLLLTEDHVATERDVILEERAQRVENRPGALLNEQMSAALFMNHPYGIPLIGWQHEMEGLTREDALSFYRDFYAPNNAVLVVAGDVEPDDVIALAKEHYGPIDANERLSPRARPLEPVPRAPRRVTLTDERVGTPYVMRNYIAPARRSEDQSEAAALVFLSEILGGSSATSVLGQALEFDQKIAVSTWAGYSADMLDLSQFSLGVVPAQDVTLEAAEAALDAEIARFFETGIDPEQFERIKTRIRANDIYAQDSARGLGNRYGRALTTGLTVADVEAWPDVLQSVTPEDVMTVARKVLQPTHSVTGWLMAPDMAEETVQ